jgi:hypothetical protein
MDRLDLLVEVILLLGALHLLLDLGVDPLVDVDLLDLDLEEVLQFLKALVWTRRLEELLLFLRRDEQVTGKRIGEAIRIGKEEGMQDFTESLRRLVVDEKIERATAFEVAPSVETLKMALKGINIAQPGIL